MAFLYPLQPNFSRGELGPRLHGRADIEHYLAALKSCTNFTVMKQGGLRKRPGFQFVATVKDHAKKVRLLPFIFSSTQAFVLEVGDAYTRPFTNGGRIVTETQAITGITQANPAVVTYSGADSYANGDRVVIVGVLGMTQVNNREFTVANLNAGANTFELSGVNSTGYDAYTSGGTVSTVFEFATPWLEAQLPDLDYVSNADVMTVAHGLHQPQEIARLSDTIWTVTAYAFLDGPYMPEPQGNHAALEFNGTGNIIPDMTGSSSPSGTASATGVVSNAAWNAMDRSLNTSVVISSTGDEQTLSYDLGGGVEKTPIGYALRFRQSSTLNGASKFRFEAQEDGGDEWVTLDHEHIPEGWSHREKRYFPVNNEIPFREFRIALEGVSFDGSAINGNYDIVEWAIAQKTSEQSVSTCTATSTAGINGGTGFTTNDVGRQIRVRGSDGFWRSFVITSRVSSTEVQGKWFGCPMPDDGDTTTVWQLGSWYIGNWPQHVSAFGERRVFGRTVAEPQTVWLTKVDEIYDFGRSVPLVADDGIALTLSAKEVAPFTWIEEGDDLIIGTTSGVRAIGAASNSEGFSATSLKQRRNTAYAAKAVKPVTVGSVLLYADFHGKVLREFFYSFDQDSYVSPDLTLLSDHFLKSGIVELHYQQSPDSVVWIVNGAGELIALTYERDQHIVAMTKVAIAEGDNGTGAFVESACVIPGTGRDELYIAVRRTIGGQTRRFIERQAAEFEDMALADAVFLDASFTYSGAATGTVSGLFNLEGQSVGVLADGSASTLTVTNGKITLGGGVTASKIHVGKKYTASARTLAISQGRDGTQLGRRKLSPQVIFDVMQSLGLKVQSASGKNTYDVFKRIESDPVSGPMNLRTGRFQVSLDQSWRDDGEFVFLSNTPEPLTIRAITPAYTSEGT